MSRRQDGSDKLTPSRIPLERLVGLLACPVCRGSLRWDVNTAQLECLECGTAYAVADGVPTMLTEASRSLLEAGRESDPKAEGHQRRWGAWLGRFAQTISPGGPSYDPGQEKRIRGMIRLLGAEANLLDLGSGGRWWGSTVIGMDVDRFPHVSVVGDGHRLPFADGILDGVICTGVLEHVDDAETVTREIWRALRPGGMVYMAVPFLQGYHPASGTHQDFRRLTHMGLQRLLNAFDRLDFGISGGPSSTLAWVLREYLAMFFVGGGRLFSVAYLVSGWLTFWLKYLDRILVHRQAAHRIACGFYFLGRKPVVPNDGEA